MNKLFFTSLITGILSGISKDFGYEHTTHALEMACGISAILCAISIILQLSGGD